MEKQPLPRKQPNYLLFIAIVSIGFDFLMLVLPYFLFDLVKSIDFYFATYIRMYSLYVLIGFTFLSFIYFLFQIKIGSWKRSIPFWLNGVTLFILMLTPYARVSWNIRMKVELQSNRTRYDEIIRRVDSGELQPMDEKGTIRLPAMLGDYVSANKDHAVTSVFFGVDTGLRDPEGFVYRSDDSPPPSSLLGGYWIGCNHEELNWYYCASLY